MANIAALLGTPMARITAAIFLAYNFVAAVGVLYFSTPLIKLMQSLTSVITGQIIFAHAAVSLLTAALFVPLLGCTVRWIYSWNRARKDPLDIDQRASFLDERILSTPGIAMIQVREEIQRMATICRSMLRDYDSLLYRFDAKKVTHIRLQGNVIAVLQQEITEFLAKLAPNLAEEQSRYEVTKLLAAVNCLELAGDNLVMMLKILERKKEQRINFSAAAMNDLKMITAALADLFDLLPQQWDETSEIAGNHVDSTRNSVEQIIAEAMEQHLERLAMGKCTVRGALIYNDLLESSSRFAGNLGKTMSIIRDYIR
jgi:phosphate:Na+ symporter